MQTRLGKKLILMILDSSILLFVLGFSVYINFRDWNLIEISLFENNFFLVILSSPIIGLPIFIYFKLYRHVVRYIDYKALFNIIESASIFMITWSIVAFTFVSDMSYLILFLGTIMTISLLVFSRISLHLISKSKWRELFSTRDSDKKFKKVLIYGAGQQGIQLMQVLETNGSYKVLGFIEDLIDIQGGVIKGVLIYPSEGIKKHIDFLGIQEIFVTKPSIPNLEKSTVIDRLKLTMLPVRSQPDLNKLAFDNSYLEDSAQISGSDLLNRTHSNIDGLTNLKNEIQGKSIIITGAGGTIGGELCKQILNFKPKNLVLYEISEASLYNIHQELVAENISETKIIPIIGDIHNKSKFSHILEKLNISTIFHAAAYKHVPMVEFNIYDGIMTNIFGTLSLAKAALENKVEKFVFISTDKAVRPSSIMGATKRVAELILQGHSKMQPPTKFTMVRFGNVLDSSGSVLPLFRKQIASGGPVTITDKDVTRYFMTTSEAVSLVMQASTMTHGGEVFLLDMGKSIKIEKLARDLISLSGNTIRDKENPDGDISIKYIGLRPGEKLHEELSISGKLIKTDNPLISYSFEELIDLEELNSMLDQLKRETLKFNYSGSIKVLKKIVPNFSGGSNIVDPLNLRNKKSLLDT